MVSVPVLVVVPTTYTYLPDWYSHFAHAFPARCALAPKHAHTPGPVWVGPSLLVAIGTLVYLCTSFTIPRTRRTMDYVLSGHHNTSKYARPPRLAHPSSLTRVPSLSLLSISPGPPIVKRPALSLSYLCPQALTFLSSLIFLHAKFPIQLLLPSKITAKASHRPIQIASQISSQTTHVSTSTSTQT